MSKIPILQTSRLILREILKSDEQAYRKHFVNYEVIRNLTRSVPWPYPEDGVIRYLRTDVFPNQAKDRWVWAITLKEEPQSLIGAIELLKNATPANRGFWLGEEFWGKGYMTEAAEAVNDYAFNTLNFKKLVFANAVGNHRSGRIKEKSGARFVRQEPAVYVDPALNTRNVYEITKSEWLEFKAKRLMQS